MVANQVPVRRKAGVAVRALLAAGSSTIAATEGAFLIGMLTVHSWQLSSANGASAIKAALATGCVGSLVVFGVTLAIDRAFRLTATLLSALLWSAASGFCFYIWADRLARC